MQDSVRISSTLPKRVERVGLTRALAARCRGAGGYYNMGNMLGLVSGIIFQFIALRDEPDASFVAALNSYLVGSPGSTALTVAMVMFFVSGELYHRAFASGMPSGRSSLRAADLLSGVAALVLAIALVMFGNVWLALISTVFLAGSKLGSALREEGWQSRLRLPGIGLVTVDLLRVATALSRLPAIAAVSLEILRLAVIGAEGMVLALAQSTVLLVCYLLWLRADMFLFRS